MTETIVKGPSPSPSPNASSSGGLSRIAVETASIVNTKSIPGKTARLIVMIFERTSCLSSLSATGLIEKLFFMRGLLSSRA